MNAILEAVRTGETETASVLPTVATLRRWESSNADALVARVRELYESGMTRIEVQTEIGPGVKVEVIMRRYDIVTRPAKPRVAVGGADHAGWKGDDAGYQAFHLRVQRQRGKPSRCEMCGTTEGQFEWANLMGDYADVMDYARLCVPCHRTRDAKVRAEQGHPSTPEALRRWEVMPNV